MQKEQKKPMRMKLAVGIIVMPIIFAWFTLQKKYSNTARITSFVWMILALVISQPNYQDNQATKITAPQQKTVYEDVTYNHYNPIDAEIICEDVAKRNVSYPETIDFHMFADGNYTSLSEVSDISIYKRVSTAKNAFGVTEQFRVSCKFDAETMLEARMVPWKSN